MGPTSKERKKESGGEGKGKRGEVICRTNVNVLLYRPTRLDESFGDRDAGSEVCNAPLQLLVNELSLISSNSRRSKDHDCVL